jgi:hypothetical protein
MVAATGPCWAMLGHAGCADQNPDTHYNCSSPWWYPSPPSPSPIQKISGRTPWPDQIVRQVRSVPNRSCSNQRLCSSSWISS